MSADTDTANPSESILLGKSQSIADWMFKGVSWCAAVAVLLTLGAIIVMLFVGARPAIDKFGFFGFLASAEWNPVTEMFGALSPIVGTLLSSFIAILIGLPVSFGIAVFITEMAPPWLKRPVGIAIELLAAIPSIIYGMWGLFIFAPFFADHIQPFFTEAFGNLPVVGPLFQGPPIGISVGCTTWEVVWHVILPVTKVGVLGGIMLGLGRALGETMAVTFVIGNSHELHAALFMPANSIASAIANEFTEADTEIYTSSLVALGLILFIVTFIVLALAKLMLIHLSALQEGKST